MRWTIFGHNPLWLTILWCVIAIGALIVVMNVHPATFQVVAGRWFFGVAALYSVSDLSVRINRYRWK